MVCKVLDRIDFPSSASSVLLFDWSTEGGRDHNLVKADSAGQLLWTAPLPTADPTDCFTSVQWDGQTLTANTWSCHRVSIDVGTGRTILLGFTK